MNADQFERDTFDFPAAFWWGWYWVWSAVLLLVAVAMAWMLTGLGIEVLSVVIIAGVAFNAGALWMLGLDQKDKHSERLAKRRCRKPPDEHPKP